VDYIARSLADGLAHVADNVAMPVLFFITVRRSLRASSSNGLLTAFSGSVRPMLRAAMTTGSVAPPILHIICGSARRPACRHRDRVRRGASVTLLASEGRKPERVVGRAPAS